MVHPPHGFDSDPDALDFIAETLEHAQPDRLRGPGLPQAGARDRGAAGALPRTWFPGDRDDVEFVGGEGRRAPRWMQRTGLEWVHRLAQPRRA